MSTEYPTLTALMAGREPGSVKARRASWPETAWIRVGCLDADGFRVAIDHDGCFQFVRDAEGPWLITAPTHTHRMTWFGGLTGRPVSHLATYEVPCPDAPAPDTLRLEIAARILAAIVSCPQVSSEIKANRHAWALAEADALLAAARAPTGAGEARK